MYSREELLFAKLQALDLQLLSQSEKNEYYKKIISLRAISAKEFDGVGYNQLHWATLCNQPEEEINRLIQVELIDINVGTRLAGNLIIASLTPLYIAVHIGSLRLAEFFLNNEANPENQRSQVRPLFGPLTGNDYSTVSKNKSVVNYALERKNCTFKLFEKSLIQQHREKLMQDQDGYDSMLPTSIASMLPTSVVSMLPTRVASLLHTSIPSFFYYSKKEELQAAEELNNLLNDDPVNTDKLVKLKKEYPAVMQNERLYEIYKASLGARRYSI